MVTSVLSGPVAQIPDLSLTMPPCHALSAVCSLPGWAVPEVLGKERLTSTVRIPMADLFIIVFNTNDSPKHLFSLHTEMYINNVHRASV